MLLRYWYGNAQCIDKSSFCNTDFFGYRNMKMLPCQASLLMASTRALKNEQVSLISNLIASQWQA